MNDSILTHIRSGLVRYVRCSTESFTSKGVVGKLHESDKKEEFAADVVVLATGFKRPSDEFLPKDLFPAAYDVRMKSVDKTGIRDADLRKLESATELVPAEFLYRGLVRLAHQCIVHECHRHRRALVSLIFIYFHSNGLIANSFSPLLQPHWNL